MAVVHRSTRSFRSTADKAMGFSICGALVAIPVFLLIYAVVKRELEPGIFFILLFILIGILTLGAMLLVDTSELLVGDTGLSRRICGRVCMQIPWTGIVCIRETFLKSQKYGGGIKIEVMPTDRSGVVLRLRRALVISDQVEDFDELIDILNGRIGQYSLRVEMSSGGIRSRQSKLLATPQL